MPGSMLSKSFLMFCIVAILIICYKIFQPFLVIIIVATILATIFYHPYEQLVKILRGRKNIAAVIMCFLVAILVIVPIANFMVYTTQRSIDTYDITQRYLDEHDVPTTIKNKFWDKYNYLGLGGDTIKSALIEIAKKVNDWIVIGTIGFMIVGMPAFFAGIAMAFLSLLPYIGAAFVWFPVGIYLIVIGKIWQGIFLFIWGAGVVAMVDNLIRAYIIKDKAQVHPIFIIFSILGGIALFGFWGVIFGPLVISLAVTVLHIYELEYESVLEK